MELQLPVVGAGFLTPLYWLPATPPRLYLISASSLQRISGFASGGTGLKQLGTCCPPNTELEILYILEHIHRSGTASAEKGKQATPSVHPGKGRAFVSKQMSMKTQGRVLLL